MPWFECSIEGENFPNGQSKRLVGFIATRWVEASTAYEAEFVALDLLRSEPRFQFGPYAGTTDARVHFTEVVEVEGPGDNNLGVAWFEMGS